jgi:hypothetical protein
VSDIDAVVLDTLKALDAERPIREAGLASPPSQTDFHIDLSAAHDDLEGDPAAESPPQVELALQEASPAPTGPVR